MHMLILIILTSQINLKMKINKKMMMNLNMISSIGKNKLISTKILGN